MDAPVGFSTGALALGDFRAALRMMEPHPLDAVELSALRFDEMPALTQAVDRLDLRRYGHVSVHAPSRYPADAERSIIAGALRFAERGWPVVLHPDAAIDLSAWNALGSMLLIENMDKRKPIGRTREELAAIFDVLPDAQLCFDIAHARQCDGTMVEAYRILTAFGNRLGQIHVSEVSSRSTHERISRYAASAFRQVSRLIPPDVPVIIESRIAPEQIAGEIAMARHALESPAELFAA